MNCARPTVMKFIFTEAILSGVSIQFHRLMAIRANSSTFIRCSRVSSNYTSISIWPHQIEASVEKHLVNIPISDVITARLLARSVVTVDYVIANTFHTIRRAICFECLFFVFFLLQFRSATEKHHTDNELSLEWSRKHITTNGQQLRWVLVFVCCAFFLHTFLFIHLCWFSLPSNLYLMKWQLLLKSVFIDFLLSWCCWRCFECCSIDMSECRTRIFVVFHARFAGT